MFFMFHGLKISNFKLKQKTNWRLHVLKKTKGKKNRLKLMEKKVTRLRPYDDGVRFFPLSDRLIRIIRFSLIRKTA
jgi:hypothetical protein